MAVTDQPSPLAWSRRALPPLAALLALYVAMPWVVRPLEAWLSPGTVARIGQAAAIGIGAALAAWVLALLRRQQRLAQRHALELEQLTLTDPLTGLGSQRAFVRDLDLAINRSRRTGESVTVLLFDVEGFQALTARHGRSTGDLTLRTLGAVLRSSVRFGSDMGYRVGPNEFAMVLAAFAQLEKLDFGLE